MAEIWYTCSLSKYLGVFFSFFKNFHFWALGTILGPNLGLNLLELAHFPLQNYT